MEERRALTRRQMVRRLGVGAGVAWAAPAILSTHVVAASGTKVCADCDEFFGAPAPGEFACGPSGGPCGCVESTTGPACIDPSAGFIPAGDPAECAAIGRVALDISCVTPGPAYFCLEPCAP